MSEKSVETIVPGEDSERIDALIWENVGLKPVSAISQMTGLPPEDILRRKNQLLEQVDVLSIEQRRQRLIIQLEGIAQDAMEKAKRIDSEFYAGTLNSAVAAIKTVLIELGRQSKTNEGALERLNQQRVQELMRLVDSTVTSTLREIAQTHNLEEAELMEVFQSHLAQEARELEKDGIA